MKNKFKLHAPIISIVLSLLAVGYTFAANVVVIPLGADSPPSGMVSAFNSETCPTGWEKYTNAQGRFVVGLNDGGSLELNYGAALGNGGYQSHGHKWGYFTSEKDWFTWHSNGALYRVMDYGDGIGVEGVGLYPFAVDENLSTDGYYYTNREYHTPPYVQLLYCEKV